jgi:predicted permease
LIELLSLFANNLLPIFLAAGTGYLLARKLKVPARPLSQAAFYIFSPCLIFYLMTHTQLSNNDIGKMVLFTVLTIVCVGLITFVIGKLFHLDRENLAAVSLTTMFNNAGNYGLAVVLFAFGEEALSYATLFFVTNALLGSSLGAVIASLGSTSLAKSLKGLLGIPALYALVFGILFMYTGWVIPRPIARAVELLANASIPALLVVLGMQLQAAQWQGNRIPLSLGVGIKLLIAPVVALILSGLIGLEGPARQAAILEASMPAAVMNTVIATEYNLHPSLVTAVVFTSTLLSPLTITPLLAYLGG